MDGERAFQRRSRAREVALSLKHVAERAQGRSNGRVILGAVDPGLDGERALQRRSRASEVALGVKHVAEHVQRLVDVGVLLGAESAYMEREPALDALDCTWAAPPYLDLGVAGPPIAEGRLRQGREVALGQPEIFGVQGDKQQRCFDPARQPIGSLPMRGLERMLPRRSHALEPRPVRRFRRQLLPGRRCRLVPPGGIGYVEPRLHQRAHSIGPLPIHLPHLQQPPARERLEIPIQIHRQPLRQRSKRLFRHRGLEHPCPLHERERVGPEGRPSLRIRHVLQEQP